MLPGAIVDLSVEPFADDYRIKFKLEDGSTVEALGRSVYDPPAPFENLADVFGFLIMQSTPADLVYRELGAIDPNWEAVVEARLRANDAASGRNR